MDEVCSKKKISESVVETNHLVLPGNTNLLGNLLGGKTVHWIDIAAALTASRHSNRKVATVSIDKINFKKPIGKGELVCLKSRLVWVGRTSMIIDVDVFSENLVTGNRRKTTEARLTFVALDENSRPAEVPGIEFESEEEERLFNDIQADINRKKSAGEI